MSIWSRIERRISDFADGFLPEEFQRELAEARSLLAEGQTEAVEKALETILAAHPEHPNTMIMVGAIYLEMGQLDAARKTFEQILAQRPQLPEALIGSAEAALQLGAMTSAIRQFRSAVDVADGDRDVLSLAYRGLGRAYRHNQDLDKAVRELRKAVAEKPRDILARAALGEALLAAPRISTEEARRHLRAVVAEADAISESKSSGQGWDSAMGTVIAYLSLGRIALRDNDGEQARDYFTKARDLLLVESPDSEHVRRRRGRVYDGYTFEAHMGLGDAALIVGDMEHAREYYHHAIEIRPQDASAHARLADAERASGDIDAAIASYDRALAIEPRVDIQRRALDAAIETEAVDTAVRLANDIFATDIADSRAMVARALGMMQQKQFDAARTTFQSAMTSGSEIEAHLGLARLELVSDASHAAGTRAAATAMGALRLEPNHERARALLAQARERELGDAGPSATDDGVAMYRLAEQLQRMTVARNELAELTSAVSRAAADLDQPLLITVMGEFSSGKSTFVNAIIGDNVAPTGITPTTATINVLKYGRERGGRIVYRDGTVDVLEWDALFAALHALDDKRALDIQQVEILYPLPQLERIHIVDTPGMNSIQKEHEEVARNFIVRADAVVWLFTAAQAGKASERRALERIHREGKRVLGVLNKVDQLAGGDIDALVDYVQNQLGALVEAVVPISARNALAHRHGVSDDAQQVFGNENGADAGDQNGNRSDGNWQALDHELETRFLAQARELKREACGRRLAEAIMQARQILRPLCDRARTAADTLRQAADTLRTEAVADFIDNIVLNQRNSLQDAIIELYRRAAREIMSLARPRLLPFGSHSATPADREYLISMLDTGYESALEQTRGVVLSGLREHAANALAAVNQFSSLWNGSSGGIVGLAGDAVSDVSRTIDDAVRLVSAQVFDAALGYLRGYVRGGYVGNFFQHALPKMELSEDAVYQVLRTSAPDLDAEIALRLAKSGVAAIESIVERLDYWASVAEVAVYDIEAGPLKALDHMASGPLAVYFRTATTSKRVAKSDENYGASS